MEPHRLKRWRARAIPDGIFYSCARPGRSKGPVVLISDSVVKDWIEHLPGNGDATVISLLGRKHSDAGDSEFKFYSSFYGLWDSESERRSKKSFQDGIDSGHFNRVITIIQHPTIDFKRVPASTIEAVSADIHQLLNQKRTVILVDSGGITRTGQICNSSSFVEMA
jgi:hypothetical protein